MDQKMVAATNPKRELMKENKKKKKQQQPLKVVYITNPMKFTATASEFRALVQELTGQDSDYSKFDLAAANKDASSRLVHGAPQLVGDGGAALEKGSDLSTSGSTTYEDDAAAFFSSPEMIDNSQASRLWHHYEDDVFRRLGEM